MSENLLGTFISKEYPLKKVLRIVSNEAVLVVRLNNEVTPKLNLLEIKAQILEEEKLVKHLQKQEQLLQKQDQELEAANKELERVRSLLEHQDTEIARLEAMIFLDLT